MGHAGARHQRLSEHDSSQMMTVTTSIIIELLTVTCLQKKEFDMCEMRDLTFFTKPFFSQI